MLYKEFKERLAELGCTADYGYNKEICIYTTANIMVARIFDDCQYDLYFFDKLACLASKKREKFINLCLEYASTPIDRRTEPTKYRVVAFRWKNGTPKNITESVAFYRRDCVGALDWTYNEAYTDERQKWTMKQIKEYDLESCERIKVD